MDNIKLLPSLLVFTEVVNRGSFTAAAAALHLSKSAVSQHIRRLETQLGTQLLSRNTRRMNITAAGTKLLARSEMLQDQVALAFQELASSEQAPSGLFSLTFPNLLLKDVATPALKQLSIEYPGLEFNIIITDEPLDIITEKLDVAIYAGELRDSSYRALPLGGLSEIFCASPTYINQNGVAKTLDDLSNYRWIATNWQKPSFAVFQDGEFSGQLELAPFARCNTLSGAVEMVGQDMGVALLPETAVQDQIHLGKMVHILPDYTGQVWPFYMVHPFQHEKPIYITRFYQLIKYYFTKAAA